MAGITAERLARLSAGFGALEQTVKNLDAATKGLGVTVQSETQKMRSTLAETAATATKVAEKLNDAAGDWQSQQLAMLERLRQMVIPFEGSDAGSQYSFDKIIEDQIAKVKAGKTSASDAIQELQRQFGSVYGTLQNTFFGSQDPETREFLDELLRFINSGRLL